MRSFETFDGIYQQCVETVFQHWTSEMQTELARHCFAWRPETFDFRNYLQLSSIRFYKAYQSLAQTSDARRLCDVGGFWGVFPMTLKALGFDVTMTESLQYYGSGFTSLFETIRSSGVTLYDFDPFNPHANLEDKFDMVTVMAVLEHYPHSLKSFMENVIGLLEPDGRIYIEVPNLAYWPKRIGLLRGQTPQAQISDIFHSEVPFIGHHHEFTISELRQLAELSGLRIISEEAYNYSDADRPSWKRWLRSPIQSLAFSFSPHSRECLSILCERSSQSAM